MNSREIKIQKTLEEEDNDRISALPDALLCHILSLLPTKHAVATTLLSTRWMYLFTSLLNLDFDDRLLLHPENGTIGVHFFTNFVYLVLLLLKSSHINSFRLNCHSQYDGSHISSWIHAALWRNVQKLNVNVLGFGLLPRDIFTCRTLVDFKLSGEFILSIPSSVCLPNLKVLHLKHVEFANNDSIRRVLLGCPVLEELNLNNCEFRDVHILDISVPLLKSLKLNCRCEGDYQIALDAPILEYLDYSDWMARGYFVKDLESLVTAHLDIGMSEEQDLGDDLYFGLHVSTFLNAISGVKFLHLSGECLVIICYSCCSLPTFQHLTHLELGLDFKGGWQWLPNLLESLPNLEVIVFFEGLVDSSLDDWDFNLDFPESVPICLAQHLKEIKIRAFGGEEDNLELVEYFLKIGRVLEKISIYTKICGEWPSYIRERLFMFPRCSKICQIVFT